MKQYDSIDIFIEYIKENSGGGSIVLVSTNKKAPLQQISSKLVNAGVLEETINYYFYNEKQPLDIHIFKQQKMIILAEKEYKTKLNHINRLKQILHTIDKEFSGIILY